MRTCRPKAPIVYNEQSKFEIGKGIRLREGKDLTIVAVGLLVFEALQAAEKLQAEGIDASVVDMHTIKPLDEDLLVEEAEKTGRFVVCEEHLLSGGLGSAISCLLAKKHPSRIEYVAVKDTYAESGKPYELLEKYSLTAPHIVKAAQRVLDKIKL